MSVIKYIIAALIVVCFFIFCLKQVKSVIDEIRNRRNKKSSKEVEKDSTTPSDDEVEKEVQE